MKLILLLLITFNISPCEMSCFSSCFFPQESNHYSKLIDVFEEKEDFLIIPEEQEHGFYIYDNETNRVFFCLEVGHDIIVNIDVSDEFDDEEAIAPNPSPASDIISGLSELPSPVDTDRELAQARLDILFREANDSSPEEDIR